MELGAVSHLLAILLAYGPHFSLQTATSTPVTLIENSTISDPSVPVCGVPEIANGNADVTPQSYALGDRTVIKCQDGYRFPGIKSDMLYVICGNDGVWTDYLGVRDLPACQRIGGCPMPVIEHGHIQGRPGGYMPDQLAHVLCEANYALDDRSQSQFIMCGADGVWRTVSGQLQSHICKVKKCDLPGGIANGKYTLVPSSVATVEEAGPVPEDTQIIYYCEAGFNIADDVSVIRTCRAGQWTGLEPSCIGSEQSLGCPMPRKVDNAFFEIYSEYGQRKGLGLDGSGRVQEGFKVLYICQMGYKSYMGVASTLTCMGGKWQGPYPTCSSQKGCSSPPLLDHGQYDFHEKDVAASMEDAAMTGRTPEGAQVFYYCDNGYRLEDNDVSQMTCVDGKWTGHMSKCVRRTHCSPPQDIPHGNWFYRNNYPDNMIGAMVQYECQHGFKAQGATELVCLDTGYWSDYPPHCLQKDMYCSEPSTVDHGFYMCKPPHCGLFKNGTEVHYVCHQGYQPRLEASMVLTCLNGGQWSRNTPVCQSDGGEADSQGPLNLHVSTLTVVIATSCGVLGLLVVVMVIVAVQRRHKSRPGGRLCHSETSSPPPYPHPSPPTAPLDEHDRVALIAFADGVQVVLPSYEEATRGRHGPRLSRFNSSDSSHSSGRSSSRADYRPLPNLPVNMRGGPQIREPPGDHPRDHHRNSIITTTSITTRDNLSLMMGSMDTMNISDGTSTSVTVDTYDSAASNPSIAASQRAAAGSLESSSTNGSIATEDASYSQHPHTDTLRNHSNSDTWTLRSVGSRSLGSELCTDTLRSLGNQSSHMQADPHPIVEVPEENKSD